MKRVAKFHKVSLEQFLKDVKGDFPQYTEADIKDIYESIELPKRATKGSAGYDFYTPFICDAIISAVWVYSTFGYFFTALE